MSASLREARIVERRSRQSELTKQNRFVTSASERPSVSAAIAFLNGLDHVGQPPIEPHKRVSHGAA